MTGQFLLHDAVMPREAAALEHDLVLRDGTLIHVRPIRSSDSERLRAFHAGLSADSIIFRFFHLVPVLSEKDAEHFTHVDYQNRMALVATTVVDGAEQIVGVVRYDAIDPNDSTSPNRAEVAFVVADKWQRHGIATILLHRMAAYARVHGCNTFVAVTMSTNTRMLDVLRHAGFPHTLRYIGGDIEAELDITVPPHPCFTI